MVESWKKRSTQQKPASKSAKKAQKGSVAETENGSSSGDHYPLPLQQALLDVFRDACVKALDVDLDSTLQEVKGHLYNRDFYAAFGKDEYLQAYAARWSPSRALAYAQVFSDISCYISPSVGDHVAPVASLSRRRRSSSHDHSRTRSVSLVEGDSAEIIAIVSNLTQKVKNMMKPSTQSSRPEPSGERDETEASDTFDEQTFGKGDGPQAGGVRVSTSSANQTPRQSMQVAGHLTRIACIGGGAGAEIVGLAGWFKLMLNRQDGNSNAEMPSPSPHHLNILNVDVAKWDKVVQELDRRITLPPVLSPYASAAAKAANSALLSSESFKVSFRQQDVLEMDAPDIGGMLGNMDLVTIMYTLNELYTASVPKAQRLLLEITACVRPGTHLLVVDSPGSYSTVVINGAEKKYPMQWLLDHTLLDEDRQTRLTNWEKLVSDESRWFRIPKGLKYPIELENMRYQIHLYRRCGTNTS
ncbi:hypothetical protein MBLNU459_g2765t1 [Dothideomycetes sp. NU459]